MLNDSFFCDYQTLCNQPKLSSNPENWTFFEVIFVDYIFFSCFRHWSVFVILIYVMEVTTKLPSHSHFGSQFLFYAWCEFWNKCQSLYFHQINWFILANIKQMIMVVILTSRFIPVLQVFESHWQYWKMGNYK